MAKVHKKHGFALVNSNRSSVTTEGKHKNAVRDALNGLMPYFGCTDPTDVKLAIKENDAMAQASLLAPLKRLKITNQQEINDIFERIHETFKGVNQLRKLMGKCEKWPKKKQLDVIQVHLVKRLARYNELNTPEIIAARKAEHDRLDALEAEAQSLILTEHIEKFRQGGDDYNLWRLNNELLRIKGDELQTSRGARVPLVEAKRMYMAIKNGIDVTGKTIGHFTINKIFHDELEVGCHRILLSEVERVLDAA